MCSYTFCIPLSFTPEPGRGFKREKMALEVELQRLRENEAAMRHKNERELSKLRYQSVEEKVRLKNEEVAMEQRFHQNVETRVCLPLGFAS